MSLVRFPNAFVWLLIAATLFMRAFVPQGHMAERTEAGTIAVKVCGSGHVLQVALGKDAAPDADERAEPPCTFAAIGAPALPPPAPAVQTGPARAEMAFAEASLTFRDFASPRPRPPARGPPPTA